MDKVKVLAIIWVLVFPFKINAQEYRQARLTLAHQFYFFNPYSNWKDIDILGKPVMINPYIIFENKIPDTIFLYEDTYIWNFSYANIQEYDSCCTKQLTWQNRYLPQSALLDTPRPFIQHFNKYWKKIADYKDSIVGKHYIYDCDIEYLIIGKQLVWYPNFKYRQGSLFRKKYIKIFPVICLIKKTNKCNLINSPLK